MTITEPTLLLDEKRCRRNIKRMAAKVNSSGAVLRPHFKTHVSIAVGRWFREEGVDRIAVSSLKMAEYFADDKWEDILVAFPVNILETDRINRLIGKTNLGLLYESTDAVEFLEHKLQGSVSGFIKIDAGYHRTGIPFDNTEEINSLIKKFHRSENQKFSGFLAHSGHSYDAKSIAEIQQIHNTSVQRMLEIKDEFGEGIISLGDTPTCSVVPDFENVGEVRPGNFVFYDLTQQQIGSCAEDDIAVALACPVVAVHPDENKIVIYGGGIHFGKDSLHDNKFGKIYGKAVQGEGLSWEASIPGAYVKSVSQEHGIVQASSEYIRTVKIGDILKILPVHSCMTADLMTGYLTCEGKAIARYSRGMIL